MRSIRILAKLTIIVFLFGCGSGAKTALPDQVIGVWKTSNPGYEDNYFELRKDEMLFGQGHSQVAINAISKVELIEGGNDHVIVATVHFMDDEGKQNVLTFEYNPKDGGTIRFQNQLQIAWKKVS